MGITIVITEDGDDLNLRQMHRRVALPQARRQRSHAADARQAINDHKQTPKAVTVESTNHA